MLTGLSPLNTYQDQVGVKKVIVIDETKISAESRARHTLLVVVAVEELTTGGVSCHRLRGAVERNKEVCIRLSSLVELRLA